MKQFATFKEMLNSEEFRKVLTKEWNELQDSRSGARTKAAMNSRQLKAHPMDKVDDFSIDQFIKEFELLEEKKSNQSSSVRAFLKELMHICVFKTISMMQKQAKAEAEAKKAEEGVVAKEVGEKESEFAEAEVVE